MLIMVTKLRKFENLEKAHCNVNWAIDFHSPGKYNQAFKHPNQTMCTQCFVSRNHRVAHTGRRVYPHIALADTKMCWTQRMLHDARISQSVTFLRILRCRVTSCPFKAPIQYHSLDGRIVCSVERRQ